MLAVDSEFGTRLVETRTNQRGHVTSYKFEVFHEGLGEVQTVLDSDYDVVQRKADAKLAKLHQKWEKKRTREDSIRFKLFGKDDAENRSAEAAGNLASLKTLLHDGVVTPADIDWKSLWDISAFTFSDASKFPLVDFGAGNLPLRARVVSIPEPPVAAATKYHPEPTFLERFWPPSKKLRQETSAAAFAEDYTNWESAIQAAQQQQAAANRMFVAAELAYAKEKAKFDSLQAESNSKIEAFRQSYLAGDEKAVSRYCEMLLGTSSYPDFIDLDFTVGFNPENGMAVIECELPDKAAIPTLQKVTFVASSRETKEKHISEAERDRLYDGLLYQVALRTIFELVHRDAALVINVVVFNGWVASLNAATGQINRGCILSLQASKDEIRAIDFKRVEPRACFKQLKGVAAARLSGLVPVRPILQLQTDDPRFVVAHSVTKQLEEGYNLATMDWEDFEHLVRELFEKEFGQHGAEVHVTQTSSDGGVDAIVLDPDPIRGGKTVIQAKRYTNTVGLSAVRDLYGTVMNEGANRGILVSTADYGADSYNFVKGKPLTLLSGANLLSLLQKHGHKARIDLKEAKIVNAVNREAPRYPR